VLIFVVFSGCSESEDKKEISIKKSDNITISGRVVDGYIRNAFACVDINNNNECDGEEPFVKTDDNGAYAIELPSDVDLSSARVLVSGGVDNSTGQPFVAILKAPLSGNFEEDIFVTPLTTVVVARVDSTQAKQVQSKRVMRLNDKSVIDTAMQEVADSFGLKSEDIFKDPIAEKNAELLSVTLQVQKTIEVLAEVEQQKSETDRTQATQRVMLAFASQIDGSKRSFASFLDDAILSDEIQQKIAVSNTTELAALLAEKVALLIESNSGLNLDESTINDISGMSQIMQDEAEHLINNHGSQMYLENSSMDMQSMNEKFDIPILNQTTTEPS
jgi:hypothetical protein